MMLNQMPAGQSEARWTQYDPGSDFKDCEYRVEEMEIFGVKQKYIMIRGTFATSTYEVSIDMPAGVTPYYPMANYGFAIECSKNDGKIRFWTRDVSVNSGTRNSISFNNVVFVGDRFLIFARTM